MRRALVVAAAGAALLLAACGATGDAGERVTPGASTATGAASPAVSAPADLVASAELVDCPPSDPDVAAREDGLPDITLPCLGDGPGVRLAGLRGVPTVLNLWASWCEPCRAELPLFSDLSVAAGPSLRVLGIAVEDDPAAALSLLTDAGVHYASMRDDERLTQGPLRWVGLPMTVLVGADGVLTYVQRGVIDDAGELATLVEEHLGVTVAP